MRPNAEPPISAVLRTLTSLSSTAITSLESHLPSISAQTREAVAGILALACASSDFVFSAFIAPGLNAGAFNGNPAIAGVL